LLDFGSRRLRVSDFGLVKGRLDESWIPDLVRRSAGDTAASRNGRMGLEDGFAIIGLRCSGKHIVKNDDAFRD
jgi:hypothetical protein